MVDKDSKQQLNAAPSNDLLDKDPSESDSETINDSVSSQGDSVTAEDEKTERLPKRVAKKKSAHTSTRATKPRPGWGTNNLQVKAPNNTPKKTAKSIRGMSNVAAKNVLDNHSKSMKVHPKPISESPAGFDEVPLEQVKEVRVLDEALNDGENVDDVPLEEVKEVDGLDDASNGVHTTGSDDDSVNDHDNVKEEDEESLDLKIENMEKRIEKLEEELREVAALEISLYSVVPEHGSSAHKVHTPARRLSRLYIYACKHWSQDKRATVAKNTVSGLVMISKACGNDVSRLTFWLSNTVVLREIITQTFGNSCQSTTLTKIFESTGLGKKSEDKSSSLKWRATSSSRQSDKLGFMEFIDDWQETRTFTAVLEKVESWIFSRIVESIWWQTLTPSMQSPAVGVSTSKTIGRLLGPALGDHQQGSFSINLWKIAFHDAFKRLCPVRAGGHECGCLPVLARMVMEKCVARLDVAMFNAILRESAHEIPTDPISDPIVDSKVLPIPAGDLSFGSGAQLKNSVGNWSRWLTDLFGMDVDDSARDQNTSGNNVHHADAELKCFHLLNALSDLLMLPKDMLIDRSVRTEVCPAISLSLLKRILCNFTPDEFCPDPVPGVVLEALNAECIIERRLSGENTGGFPCSAAKVVYKPPSSADVAEKVAEAGGISQMSRSVSAIQRKGYTSDEELEELHSPLLSIIEKPPSSPTIIPTENGTENGESMTERGYSSANTRFDLLREVWLS